MTTLPLSSPTTNTTNSTLTIQSPTDISTKTRPASYHILVILHALLLGATFILLFPLGVLALRWKWSFSFVSHWMLQLFGSIAAFIGLGIAIGMTEAGIEYTTFDKGHQILGLVVGLVMLQVVAGYVHHRRYVKVRARTWVSYLHLGLGRLVIYLGMITAVL